MVDLLIRNLPPETHKALKKLAAERDTTLSETARDLLVRGTDTVPKRPLGEVLAELQQKRAALPPGPVPDIVETIREMREERDDRILDATRPAVQSDAAK